MSAPDRRAMVERSGKDLSVRRQCALVGVARSGIYRPKPVAGGGPPVKRPFYLTYCSGILLCSSLGAYWQKASSSSSDRAPSDSSSAFRLVKNWCAEPTRIPRGR